MGIDTVQQYIIMRQPRLKYLPFSVFIVDQVTVEGIHPREQFTKRSSFIGSNVVLHLAIMKPTLLMSRSVPPYKYGYTTVME